MLEKIRLIVFADYRIQNENVPQFRSGFFIVVAGIWSERKNGHFGSKVLSRAYGLKGKNGHFGSKELSRAYGLKGKNAIWVKRIVAGVWSKGEKRHLGQKNCHGRMV